MPTPFTIIYRDEYLIAIHKPAGLLVHKSPIDKHETQYAMQILRDQIGQWVYPLHRLDRPTSGVLLFGLSPKIAQLMGQQFEQQAMGKTYRAIVRGYTALEGIIDHPLKPTADFKQDKQRMALKPAQEAVTHYRRLGIIEVDYAVDQFPTSRYSLVELYPKTGRKHQLRKHAKHLSHPIIGDPKYGKSKHNHFFKQHFNCHRLLLAAIKMDFAHPITAQPITINAEIDGIFSALQALFIVNE
ncbi:MAG: tRNA pseudouridine65 synthase [Candidatus Endobugula sp.]|jgi:tRNA pseudouridine65 synthase